MHGPFHHQCIRDLVTEGRSPTSELPAIASEPAHADVTKRLRDQGIKLGCSTGFTRPMVDILEAADAISDHISGGAKRRLLGTRQPEPPCCTS